MIKTNKPPIGKSKIHKRNKTPPLNQLANEFDSTILNCPTCSQPFSFLKQNKPRILPCCGHTICEGCLIKSILADKSDSVLCLICKNVNSLFLHKCVEDFPYNWTIIDILERIFRRQNAIGTEKDESKERIEKCGICKLNDSSHWCRLHFLNICVYCALKHMKECKREKICENEELPSILKKNISTAKELIDQINEKIKEAKLFKSTIAQELGKKIDELILKINTKKEGILFKIDIYIVQLESIIEGVEGSIIKNANVIENNITNQRTKIMHLNILEDLLHTQDKDKYKLDFTFNSNQHKEILKNIDNLCNINTGDEIYNDTTNQCLFKACVLGNEKIVDFLLGEKKIDINLKDQHSGYTPLITSIVNSKSNIINLLIEKYKANVNFQDINGNTPLMHCCLLGLDDIALYLIRTCKANANIQNELKDTALHFAIKSRNINIIKLLTEEGHAEMNTTNSEGERPLGLPMIDIIKRNNKKEIK